MPRIYIYMYVSIYLGPYGCPGYGIPRLADAPYLHGCTCRPYCMALPVMNVHERDWRRVSCGALYCTFAHAHITACIRASTRTADAWHAGGGGRGQLVPARGEGAVRGFGGSGGVRHWGRGVGASRGSHAPRTTSAAPCFGAAPAAGADRARTAARTTRAIARARAALTRRSPRRPRP